MAKYKHTCPGCDSLVEFDESDLMHGNFTNKFDIFGLDYVCCPVCHAVLPFRIFDPATGEIYTDFEFHN